MIDAIEIELPVAGITEVEIQFGGGTNIITSATAPSDTSSGWLDPETGVLAYYVGGGWVTQSLGGVGYPDGTVTFDGNIMTFQGNTLTFTS